MRETAVTNSMYEIVENGLPYILYISNHRSNNPDKHNMNIKTQEEETEV